MKKGNSRTEIKGASSKPTILLKNHNFWYWVLGPIKQDHFFRLRVIVPFVPASQRIFWELSLCLCSWHCRWRDSAWVWPPCTSLRLLHWTVSCGYQQSWDTRRGSHHKIRTQLRDERHRWKMLYTSPELMVLLLWRYYLKVRVKDPTEGTTSQ